MVIHESLLVEEPDFYQDQILQTQEKKNASMCAGII
jgi:hypothetical protein